MATSSVDRRAGDDRVGSLSIAAILGDWPGRQTRLHGRRSGGSDGLAMGVYGCSGQGGIDRRWVMDLQRTND
jgi:hypothetical protein